MGVCFKFRMLTEALENLLRMGTYHNAYFIFAYLNQTNRKMKRNAVVAQSGGPSPVINASLAGVLKGCAGYPGEINQVFAAWHGVEGVLQEELINMNRQPDKELELLMTTPASGAIGTCRYKLGGDMQEDYERILEVFRAHDISYFFYIGGNDSMDTAAKVSELASAHGYDLIVAGVPKTIDNDLGDEAFTLIDHTPGYGSTARYWMSIVSDANQENRAISTSECVCVLQAMGRSAGYIPAAVRLADPDREMPLQIYTAESGHNLESLHDHVNRQLGKSGRCIVVVSEGFDVGNIGAAFDRFGHIEYGASKQATAQIVANYLNEKGLSAKGQATWQVPGILQRSTSLCLSSVDMDEAFRVGEKAVEIALSEGSGYMATLLRKPGISYEIYYDKVPLEKVAVSARQLPKDWLSPDGLDVTDEFINYAMPLVGEKWTAIPLKDGRPRFSRLKVEFVDKKCRDYTPLLYRR
jgi:6-phosphofructokinase